MDIPNTPNVPSEGVQPSEVRREEHVENPIETPVEPTPIASKSVLDRRVEAPESKSTEERTVSDVCSDLETLGLIEEGRSGVFHQGIEELQYRLSTGLLDRAVQLREDEIASLTETLKTLLGAAGVEVPESEPNTELRKEAEALIASMKQEVLDWQGNPIERPKTPTSMREMDLVTLFSSQEDFLNNFLTEEAHNPTGGEALINRKKAVLAEAWGMLEQAAFSYAELTGTLEDSLEMTPRMRRAFNEHIYSQWDSEGKLRETLFEHVLSGEVDVDGILSSPLLYEEMKHCYTAPLEVRRVLVKQLAERHSLLNVALKENLKVNFLFSALISKGKNSNGINGVSKELTRQLCKAYVKSQLLLEGPIYPEFLSIEAFEEWLGGTPLLLGLRTTDGQHILRKISGMSLEVAKRLINMGADVNALNRSGFPVLWDLVESGRLDLCELLLQKGANPNIYCDMYTGSLLDWARVNAKLKAEEQAAGINSSSLDATAIVELLERHGALSGEEGQLPAIKKPRYLKREFKAPRLSPSLFGASGGIVVLSGPRRQLF